jgi:hypothetical protein
MPRPRPSTLRSSSRRPSSLLAWASSPPEGNRASSPSRAPPPAQTGASNTSRPLPSPPRPASGPSTRVPSTTASLSARRRLHQRPLACSSAQTTRRSKCSRSKVVRPIIAPRGGGENARGERGGASSRQRGLPSAESRSVDRPRERDLLALRGRVTLPAVPSPILRAILRGRRTLPSRNTRRTTKVRRVDSSPAPIKTSASAPP